MHSLFFSTWRESCMFFVSSDARIYPLLILNTFFRTIKLLTTYFFWFIPFLLYSHVKLLQELLDLNITPTAHMFTFTSLSSALAETFICFIIILSVRTSLEPKNLTYFVYFSPYLFLYAIFWMFPHISIFPLVWLASFFFFDTDCSIKSFFWAIIRGISMIVYFLPLFFVVGLIVMSCVHVIKIPTIFLLKLFVKESLFPLLVADFIITLLYNILVASTMSVFYIMLKHRHYKLFFN
jgi:hypothetical protein